MKTQRLHVYFQDEAPRIGAGWRPVLAQIGYKWVRIKTPGAERGVRIKRETWDTLRKDDNYEYKKPRAKKAVRMLNLL
jgi:hypothetical protein